MKPAIRSPLRVFLQVLLVVFLAEAGVMLVLPLVVPRQSPEMLRALLDSSLLTLLIAPVFYWTIVRPLRVSALEQQARAEAYETSSEEGIITFTRRGVIESLNPAAEKLFGVSGRALEGTDLGRLFPWQFLPLQEEKLAAEDHHVYALASSLKISGRRNDGTEIALNVSLRGLRSGSRLIYTAVLREAADREREAMRVEQMAAVAQLGVAFAHRLRNPLTAIKMLVQAGTRPEGPLTLEREDLQVIVEELRRAERSVQLFLDFAHPPKPVFRAVDFATLVAEEAERLRAKAAGKRVGLQITRAETDCQLAGDAAQLRELVGHLLLNALDASSPGATVEVHVGRIASCALECRVLDRGPGVVAGLQAKLFQPFVTSKATGMGLGLAVAQRIARDHSGVLGYEPREGGGSCFWLRIPHASMPPANGSAVEVLSA